jgi:DNA helicase-2/ATP-dependent DNA helicase PcrA
MRRYQLKYHVVGGFSFYERAEIKDMVSYLKLVHNPDDTISLLRVLNRPARGIGKTTVETIEHLALETGLSMWGAIGEAIERQLLPARALAALRNFRDMIEDARAMLAGTYAERLAETAQRVRAIDLAAEGALPEESDTLQPAKPEDNAIPDEQIAFDPALFAFSAEDDAASPEVALPNDQGSTSNDALADDGPLTSNEDSASGNDAFRSPGGSATTAEVLKFLIDRSGYIKALEEEDTPESLSRIENLKELVNAALDSRDRGETLDEFLDHAALVSDADDYDPDSQITLMTLHAAKGLEFPLVFLAGLEEGLFPHSRTLLAPDEIEEERRLCYVGMTRAMDALILTRARYRRRYGTDLPEASVASRFLEEVPPQLLQDLGSPKHAGVSSRERSYASESSHYAYEDEDQSATWTSRKLNRNAYSGPVYNSIDNIAEFFASRGKKFSRPRVPVAEPTGKRGFRPGQKVRHPKFGEGTVFRREGEGEDAKITVQFPRFGLKTLVEKYAQLEKSN